MMNLGFGREKAVFLGFAKPRSKTLFYKLCADCLSAQQGRHVLQVHKAVLIDFISRASYMKSWIYNTKRKYLSTEERKMV